MPWTQVLRTSGVELDPLYLAIYGGVLYHHGAGLTGGLSPAHRALAPKPLSVPSLPGLRSAARLLNAQRWRRWERHYKERIARQSQRVYDKIAGDANDWLAELR
jgi:hypothetical protein